MFDWYGPGVLLAGPLLLELPRWNVLSFSIFSPFKISNGTHQGSVLIPAIFSVYIDDMIQDLRRLGCYKGGLWIGACGFPDDLILLAPGRRTMENMLVVCEDYTRDHCLQFSSDPNPTKSMTGYRLRGKKETYSSPIRYG